MNEYDKPAGRQAETEHSDAEQQSQLGQPLTSAELFDHIPAARKQLTEDLAWGNVTDEEYKSADQVLGAFQNLLNARVEDRGDVDARELAEQIITNNKKNANNPLETEVLTKLLEDADTYPDQLREDTATWNDREPQVLLTANELDAYGMYLLDRSEKNSQKAAGESDTSKDRAAVTSAYRALLSRLGRSDTSDADYNLNDLAEIKSQLTALARQYHEEERPEHIQTQIGLQLRMAQELSDPNEVRSKMAIWEARQSATADAAARADQALKIINSQPDTQPATPEAVPVPSPESSPHQPEAAVDPERLEAHRRIAERVNQAATRGITVQADLPPGIKLKMRSGPDQPPRETTTNFAALKTFGDGSHGHSKEIPDYLARAYKRINHLDSETERTGHPLAEIASFLPMNDNVVEFIYRYGTGNPAIEYANNMAPYKEPSGGLRGGCNLELRTELPESVARELKAAIEADPAALRHVVDTLIMERGAGGSAADKAQFETLWTDGLVPANDPHSLRPPYEGLPEDWRVYIMEPTPEEEGVDRLNQQYLYQLRMTKPVDKIDRKQYALAA